MSLADSLSAEEVNQLRADHYNGVVTRFHRVHDELAIIRVRPDDGLPAYEPGQYTVLGLGNWERRIEGVQEETLEARDFRKLVKRAYSMSATMLDPQGRLLRTSEQHELEFYITLVRFAAQHAPALTPRLFALDEGDRLFVGPHPHGNYTLAPVNDDHNVVFAGTGTGEAPHNAMLVELLARGHRGRIAVVTCVRYRKDLAYAAAHRRIESAFPQYRYLTLTTREPQNVDPSRPDYVGKQYVQQYVASGRFEADWGAALDPHHTHVFLCGSPAMIGAPQHTHALRFYPKPTGMVETLEERGFQMDEPHQPGNVHLEKYW